MKRILVAPFSGALSHLSRALVIAGELKNRGHEVIFATDDNSINNRFVNDEGFERIHLIEPESQILFDNIRQGNIKFISHELIEYLIGMECQLFRQMKPDLILSDGRFTVPISAQFCKTKHVAIVNASSCEYRSIPYVPFLPDSWYAKIGNFSSRLCDLLTNLNLYIEKKAFDTIMKSFTVLSKRFSLPHLVTATNCLTGVDMTLLADIPEYFPTRNLPDSYRYIGPVTWKTKNLPVPSRLPELQGSGRKTIYITMGTTGVVEFFPIVYELLKQMEINAIITTGAQLNHFKSDVDHILIAPYLDGDRVIHASDITICHGGNGTIYQSLNQGKPVIGIPTIPDQEFNMRRVESLGLGKKIPIDRFFKCPSVLIDAVDEVASKSIFFKNAGRIKKRLRQFNTTPTASDLIEQLL